MLFAQAPALEQVSFGSFLNSTAPGVRRLQKGLDDCNIRRFNSPEAF